MDVQIQAPWWNEKPDFAEGNWEIGKEKRCSCGEPVQSSSSRTRQGRKTLPLLGSTKKSELIFDYILAGLRFGYCTMQSFFKGLNLKFKKLTLI